MNRYRLAWREQEKAKQHCKAGEHFYEAAYIYDEFRKANPGIQCWIEELALTTRGTHEWIIPSQ